MPNEKVLHSALKWFSEAYFDHNGTSYDVLDAPPTAVEFSRLVHISRPVVIKGYHIPAYDHWTNDYLLQRMGDRKFSVAITPNGRADAVTPDASGNLYFVEPHVEKLTMADFLKCLDSDCDGQREICYLQSQNGNLFSNRFFELGIASDPSEFNPLRDDVPSEIPWCSEALARMPDAVNLWIGDSHSVTSIHNDPYENIYTVVRGSKQFTLIPPSESWSMQERLYPHARYTRSPSNSDLVLTPSDSPPVRWSCIQDPNAPGALSPYVHPIEITLNAGETLYLPAGWWHYVRQSYTTIALNWWYDIEPRGMDWVLLRFLRGTANDQFTCEAEEGIHD